MPSYQVVLCFQVVSFPNNIFGLNSGSTVWFANGNASVRVFFVVTDKQLC